MLGCLRAADTHLSVLEETLNKFLARSDIGIVLINQHVRSCAGTASGSPVLRTHAMLGACAPSQWLRRSPTTCGTSSTGTRSPSPRWSRCPRRTPLMMRARTRSWRECCGFSGRESDGVDDARSNAVKLTPTALAACSGSRARSGLPVLEQVVGDPPALPAAPAEQLRAREVE